MLNIHLDRRSPQGLARQIYGEIRDAIFSGAIRAGEALPSTRELAATLAVSRNTVTEAYSLLNIEGYITTRQGSPCRVAEGLAPLEAPAPEPERAEETSGPYRYDFATGRPEVDRFPLYTWRQIHSQVLTEEVDLLYGDPQGLPALREEIAAWLLRCRGIRVSPGDVYITCGATHAISLAVGLMGGAVAVENPCHLGIVRLLEQRGIPPVPVPVDREGLRVDAVPGTGVGGVYVTPSHQFPLGVVMRARRRQALIQLARKRDIYILEDDYDSELRYTGQPLSPLYTLDPGRVIYVGTFSKSMFPALRVGFALVPPALKRAWLELRRYSDVQSPDLVQRCLAEFLRRRKLDRHIRAMTRLYGDRRAVLLEEIRRRLGPGVEVLGDGAGLHMAVRVPGKAIDTGLRDRCRRRGLNIVPCAQFDLSGGHWDTVLLGYGRIEAEDIPPAMALLAEALDISPPG